jgi:exodeoxyribonuclease VII large subunit
LSDPSPSNAHEFTVSELAGALKRTVEDNYGHVRVRGELGRVVIARSGHVYMDLKDDRAVISSIIWKGVASRLRFAPEEGLEVIAEGRLSTYPGRSQYQLIIESMEPAGAGALMALLEERRKKFQAEGLFDDEHKKPLPFLPKTIGVITSPTGAVIRDILHRLRDRFPRHVLLWPVLVQGDQASGQISAAIDGFNALGQSGDVPRPDLLIVARGGGSIEDLWAFNEENVVRAAARSDIPLISAVGHETDWTLIDYVSDRRAPTPTGAAEIAVPVRTELLGTLQSHQSRLGGAMLRLTGRKEPELRAAARGLPRPEDLLGVLSQRFDYTAERLTRALQGGLEARSERLLTLGGRLRPEHLRHDVQRRDESLSGLASRARIAFARGITERERHLSGTGKLLKSLSHEGVLARGFALVQRPDGTLVRKGAELMNGETVHLQFADTRRSARIEDGTKKPTPKPRAKKKFAPPPSGQGSLF